MAVSQDAWRISAEDRAKHDVQFFQLKPVNGFVTGTQARDFFMQSGLPTQVLGQIWSLADINGDGKMDKKEFSIAMHLIKKKLQGYELPKVLPAILKADPSPMIGSFVQPVPAGIPMSQPVGMSFPVGAVPGSYGVQPSGSIWTMPQASKLKHTQTFNANDRNKKGFLLGVEARAILVQSGLPQHVLAQIWTLSDIDQDGKLTCDEFCIAMHLSELARMGHALPAALPQELIPMKPAPANITSPPLSASLPGAQKDAFGDLLSGVGMPLPVAPTPVAQPVEDVIEEQVTFEDKRKENFDKGQAELERRRAILREQQQKEENERLEKERQEAEKRERQRQEAENKRQAELQRQLEKQREKEREIEEQRRKMLEQREAARRELERQRQMEWEKQRKEQLMVEKQREYEQLGMLKSQMANLRNELESLEAKKAELSLKISQVQSGVIDFTTTIDAMRVSRDKTLADIDLFERQSLELNKKCSALDSEKDALNIQVQSAQTTPMSDTHRSVANSVEMKRTSIQRLKNEVEQLEKNTEARLIEIDCSNAELKNLKEQLIKLERDLPQLKKQQEEKRKMQQVQKDKSRTPAVSASKPTAISQPSWFDFNSSEAVNSVAGGGTSTISWDTAFSSTSSSAAFSNTASVWDSSGKTTVGGGSQGGRVKHRAMYDFPAGRDDELTLVAGMEIWVLTDFTPVPGMEDWYKGEHAGKTGWFPKAYVERLDEPTTDLFGGAFDSLVQSSSVQKPDIIQEDLFSSQFTQQSSAISNAPVDTSAPSHIPPEGLLAKALYPWKARHESDLNFDKDETILVRKQEDMKYYGELCGKSGWFPKAYVKIVGAAPKSGLATDGVKTSQMKTSNAPSPAPDIQGEYYVAMYTYTSDEPADLNFNEGDMIYVTASSGDWWSGTIADQGKSGIFPANYVKKLDVQPEMKSAKKSEIARVIAPYVATGAGQLSLEPGNLINVRQKSPRGWWEGELQVRGQKKKIGWFPANYVKLLGSSSARTTPEPTASATLTMTSQSSSQGQNGDLIQNQYETVVALYAYTAQNDDELTFQKDAVITVLSRENPDWWSGQVDGQTGVFPSNYVTSHSQAQL